MQCTLSNQLFLLIRKRMPKIALTFMRFTCNAFHGNWLFQLFTKNTTLLILPIITTRQLKLLPGPHIDMDGLTNQDCAMQC